MSNYNRRYIVLKDEALDSSEVTSIKSTTVPPSSEETKAEMYGESYGSPSVSENGDASGDLSISASGQVREQYATNTSINNTYAYGKGPSLKKVDGEGLITTTGSVSASRFTVSRGDDNAYNLRTTPNYFNRLPFTLDRIQHDWTLSIPEQQNYSRSDVLSLKNGSLLTAYLKSNSASWTWNFQSNLIGNISLASPAVTIQNTYNDNLPSPGVIEISNLTFTSGSINDLNISMVLADSPTITQSTRIFKIDSIDTAGGVITLAASTFGLYTLYAHSVGTWDNKPGSNLKLRCTDEKEGTWTAVNASYPSTGSQPNLTGVALVQFDDTEEVLVLTSGWQGGSSDFGSSSTFLTVDHIQSDFSSSLGGFASSVSNGSIVDRRSISVLLEFEGWLANSVKTDVAGLTEGGTPLDITAKVLPSGRLVCVVAFPKTLVSLVSDDRGMSFSATEIMSLQFGGEDEQLFVSLDSTLTNDGDMALLLVANPIGNRAYPDSAPSSSDFLPSSIISLFLTSSGTSWSDEKNIGTNLSPVAYPYAVDAASSFSYPFNFSTWLDESVYGFDGSVCLNGEGNLVVSLCTVNLGGPGCQQGGHLFQRVITPSEINAGMTNQQLAPSLPPIIFSSSQPVTASYSRLGMAIPYLAKGRDLAEVSSTSDAPILEDYMYSISPTAIHDPFDTGYLGSLYFAGKIQVGGTTLLPKLYGGGPSLARGPISVSSTLHCGEMVTVLGETWESSPSDSPNSQFYLRSRISQRSLESTIHVLRSGGLQPLRVNLPNQMRRFDVALSADGKVGDTRFDDGGVPGFNSASGVIRPYGINTQNYVDPVAKSFETEVDLNNVATSLATRTRTCEIGKLTFGIASITNNGATPPIYTVTCSGPDSFNEVFDGAGFYIPSVAAVTGSTIKDSGSMFGSNSFQVSLLGAKDPTLWGWQVNTNDATQASYVEDAGSGLVYANKWEIDTPSGATLPYLYYNFAAGLNSNSPYEDYAFPNAKGEALRKQNGPEYESTQIEANSFVCRAVVQIQKGGARGSTVSSTDSGSIRCGVSVALAQGGSPYASPSPIGPDKFVGLALSIARVSGTVYFSLIELGRSGGSDTYQMINNSEISMTDEGTGSNVYEKVPFYEVVWGLRHNAGSEYLPFIFVRKLSSIDDPKSEGPFTTPAVNLASVNDSNVGYQGGTELFRFGSYTDAFNVSGGNAVQCSFASVQMSRSFLSAEDARAVMYAPDDSPAFRSSVPTSMADFTESLHIFREPALDFLRSANAGQMAPMAFSNATVFPQDVDRGVELSFRGRATAQAAFSYEALSKFPATAIVNPPVKDGWRSPTETISFDIRTEDTTVFRSIARLPTYEMTFYSEEGFNPEACALFGLNTASVRIDFNSNSTFGDYGSATQPDFTMLFTTPGDPSSLLFNYYNNADLIRDARTSPPASALGGQQFLVLPGATGAWVGQDGKIATYNSLSATYTFADASRGDAVILELGSEWYLYVGSLSWIEYQRPNIFYKPVYLQHFVKYSLYNPSQELVSDRTWEFSADAPDTVFFKKNTLVNFEVEDVLDATPGNPAGFTGESYLMSADASVAPNEIITSDGSFWNTTPPTLDLVVRVSESATSSLAGKMLRYNGSQWVVRVLNDLPPFRPSQYKSQSNENFYLVVVERRATLMGNVSDTLNVLDDLEIKESGDMKYTYYFKILDNGSDYLKLDRPITNDFSDTLSSAQSNNRLTPACMTIVSDRIAANSPDFFDTLNTGPNRSRYKYMRITLCGGNHSDDSLRLGALVMGPSIPLSYPDFNLGYSYGLDEGSSLFDSLSGRRKSRRNHKPRKTWDVSYAPRPSAKTTIVSAGFGTEVINTVGGNGNYDDPIANAAQNSRKARASWQELLERVLAMGINGPMLALGFDGNNMQTLAGTAVNIVPKGKNIRPALSDPNGLCPVRLTGYAGATNVAFQGSQIISTSQGGTGSNVSAPQVLTNQTECVPSAIMEIKGLKFSEEL